MADFFEVLAKRESCRNFINRPVEKELLTRMVEAACLAPSACNSQPWDFIVVSGDTLPPQVAKLVQGMGMNKFAEKAPAFVIVVEGVGNLSSKMGGKIKRQDYTAVDIGIAAAHICLAATALGLSTCILGWFDEDSLKELLKLTPEKRIRLAICVGYGPEEAIRKKVRRDISDIVTYVE